MNNQEVCKRYWIWRCGRDSGHGDVEEIGGVEEIVGMEMWKR